MCAVNMMVGSDEEETSRDEKLLQIGVPFHHLL